LVSGIEKEAVPSPESEWKSGSPPTTKTNSVRFGMNTATPVQIPPPARLRKLGARTAVSKKAARKHPGRKRGRLPKITTAPVLNGAAPRRLILRCWYSLGDITLLTAAVRELHRAHPGRFLTDVRTPFDDLWLHNPWLTPMADGDGEVIECDYALLSESNHAPYHAIHSFTVEIDDMRPTGGAFCVNLLAYE
jgi:hypothetical protein